MWMLPQHLAASSSGESPLWNDARRAEGVSVAFGRGGANFREVVVLEVELDSRWQLGRRFRDRAHADGATFQRIGALGVREAAEISGEPVMEVVEPIGLVDLVVASTL